MNDRLHYDPVRALRRAIALHPSHLLLETAGGQRYSYAQFGQRVELIARALHFHQVTAGQRVVAQVDKSPDAVALYLACLQIGAVFVPLNNAYTTAELEYFVQDAQPSLVVVSPASADAHANRSQRVVTLGIEGDGTLFDIPTDTAAAAAIETDGDTLACLIYTSGTTGRSKGAMLTRGNLASNASTLVDQWRFSRHDILIHALPIFHVHGLLVAINTVLAAGATMLFASRFDPEAILRWLPRATVFMGVPTHYTRLLEQPALTAATAANMRLFISGSAPLLPETHREFMTRTGHEILERYGMSETLMNTSNPYEGARVPGSVGPALPGVEIRITDAATGTTLQCGQIGMIEVRGPNVFCGYWQQPEKTAQEMRADGFFITGDLGYLDERGYVHLIGRNKDLIISGGLNVYPREVEIELDALPQVKESAVFGVPHPDFGEAVTAVVVRQDDAVVEEAAIRSALATRLAPFKLPKRVLFVTQLPRNTMGKVQKAVLRERYAALYRDSDGAIEHAH